MQRSSVQHTIRVTALIVAVLFSGATLAAQKTSSSDDAKANCLNQAAVQFSIDQAQCSGYPTYSGAYSVCMSNASTKFAQATIACSQTAALTGVGGLVDTTAGGGKGKRPTFGLRKAGGLLTILAD